ncbi:hypothetical protein [Acidisphaera sp. S103]|uniref:hypothetical protein n=1 Tax=Acidisphaera sp. S103 TaxID=1747223 RepID=UPI00131CDEE3|nr:hypothetical protein [Acidisphaera sp. S103]
MMDLVLALLTPFFAAAGLPDPRQAAQETIAAYRTTNPDQLLTAVRVVTFALATIDNLRLSLTDDVSLSMKLKLRSNANALNRTSQKAADTLEAAPPPKHSQDQAWAAAMTEIATEYTAELPNLPPAQRQTQLARISALSDIAKTLATNKAPPRKARLLGSTAIQPP